MSSIPYERQDGETKKQFEAFKIYRDLGPLRSISEVVRTLNKSRALIGRWSAQNNWVDRAAAYDDYLDRKERIELEQQRKKMAKRQAGQAALFQQKALQALKSMDPEEMDPKTMISFFEKAAKIERLALGASTESAEINHSGEVIEKHEHTFSDELNEFRTIYKTLHGEGEPESED